MRVTLLIALCLMLIACNTKQANEATASKVYNIHPDVVGVIKSKGQGLADIQVSLSSSSCDMMTALTDDNGLFKFEQFCLVKVMPISVAGTVVGISFPFDITITTDEKSFIGSVIDPFNVNIEIDLSEQMLCITNQSQQRHCDNLVLLDAPSEHEKGSIGD